VNDEPPDLEPTTRDPESGAASPDSSATGRFGLPPAPGGLRLAQDLVNTSLSAHQGKPELDHLADLPTASAWLQQALAGWSSATGKQAPDISLQSRDLAPLRTLRERLRQSLRANAAHVPPTRPTGADDAASSDIRLTLDTNGRIDYRSLASGWRGVAALISIEMLLAQAAGSRPRLKTCALPACGACFHDGSPNQARVWHDTKLCGNGPNLRASRARRASPRPLGQSEGTPLTITNHPGPGGQLP
jgi:predicted RNA-binding Zn ribbon-like protein